VGSRGSQGLILDLRKPRAPAGHRPLAPRPGNCDNEGLAAIVHRKVRRPART